MVKKNKTSEVNAAVTEHTNNSLSGDLKKFACTLKRCSFGLPRVPFVNCRRFMYLVISLLVYRAGCGI